MASLDLSHFVWEGCNGAYDQYPSWMHDNNSIQSYEIRRGGVLETDEVLNFYLGNPRRILKVSSGFFPTCSDDFLIHDDTVEEVSQLFDASEFQLIKAKIQHPGGIMEQYWVLKPTLVFDVVDSESPNVKHIELIDTIVSWKRLDIIEGMEVDANFFRDRRTGLVFVSQKLKEKIQHCCNDCIFLRPSGYRR